MEDLALRWYTVLSSLNSTLALPLRELAAGANASVFSALIFGLIGATSPCQITTNVSALAYFIKGSGSNSPALRSSLAYLLGKVVVYTLLGTAAILVGRQFEQAAIPVVATTRKIVGPAMILLALYMFRLLPLRFTVGSRLSRWVEQRAGRGSGGAFLLGTAFALAFCPTLFFLFFGLTVPLALSSPASVIYPAIFAVGTTLPLLAVGVILAVTGSMPLATLRSTSRLLAPRLQVVAAVVILLAGINDTWLYWMV